MRYRLVWITTAFVAAAHWLVLLGPGAWSLANISLNPPDAPQHIDAVWVELPPAVTPALNPPARAPHTVTVPRAAPRPAKAPPRPPSQAPTAVAPPLSIASPEDMASPANLPPEPATAQADSAATAMPPPSAPAHPRLQVRNSAGESLPITLPSDGTALDTDMLLRFKVHGFVKGMQYHANAELQWRTEGDRYHARQSISAFLLGSMEQTSTGLLTAQGLQPLLFTDRRFAKRRSVALDWQAQQATFDPAREPAPIGPGAQDRLSVFLQLASMLQALPELRTPGTRIDIPTLGSRRLQMWTFVVEQTDTVELPNGPVAALRLQRQPQAGDEDTAQLWVNPTQGYVPVRIHMQERNGDVMDFSLKP